MGGINQGKIYNELAEIREEIKKVKSQIYFIEAKLDSYSDFLKPQTEPVVNENAVEPEIEKQDEKITAFETKKEQVFREKIGFEENIGKKWFSRIGIISIFIGMVFFIKYLYDRHLMSPVEKVSLGIIVGLLMLIAGGFLNNKKYEKKYEYLSRTLTGGGFAVLYLIIYNAYNPYGLIPADIDMILLGFIIVSAVFLSLRYSSMVIASEAFFLGYIISFLGRMSEYTLVYATVLTIGLVVIVQRKGWIKMAIGGLIAIYFTHILWLFFYRPEKDFAINTLFLSLYFIIFTILAYTIRKPSEDTASLENFQSVLFKIPESYHGILIVALNAIFSYGLFYLVVNAHYKAYTGLFTMIVAGVYLALAYAALNKNAKELFAIYLTLCTTFITITIPVQFNYQWITFAWAIEGFVLLVMGFRYNAIGLRVFGNIVGIIVLVKTLLIDTELGAFDIDNLLKSTRFFAFLIAIITFYASSAMYFKNKDKPEYESEYWKYYLIGGGLLTTLILALELNDGWITIAWAIEAIAILIAGFRYELSFVRKAGIVLLLLTIVKVFIIDLSDLETLYRIMSFMVLGAILMGASFLYSKYKDKL